MKTTETNKKDTYLIQLWCFRVGAHTRYLGV